MLQKKLANLGTLLSRDAQKKIGGGDGGLDCAQILAFQQENSGGCIAHSGNLGQVHYGSLQSMKAIVYDSPGDDWHYCCASCASSCQAHMH